MTNTDTADQIKAYASQAMDQLNTLELVPSPSNYELFYTYVTGKSPDLNREMDSVLQSGTPLTDDMAEDLYIRHCKDQTAKEAIESAGTELLQEMSEIQAHLELASRDTNAYSNALEGVNQAIKKGENDPNLLSQIVRNIISATQAMEEKTRKLENDLESSTHEISRLRDNLVDSQREALTDGLTRLANRKHFDQKIQEAVREVYETGQEMSILIADVDHFKKFNDTWGHPAGDQILRLIGKCMKENVKGKDTAARYGGEEFAIVFPQTGLEGALSVAEQIRTAVESKKIIKKSTGECLGRVTMSFGVAQYRQDEQICDLVSRADTALYAAKEGGRNLVLGEHELPDKKEDAAKSA